MIFTSATFACWSNGSMQSMQPMLSCNPPHTIRHPPTLPHSTPPHHMPCLTALYPPLPIAQCTVLQHRPTTCQTSPTLSHGTPLHHTPCTTVPSHTTHYSTAHQHTGTPSRSIPNQPTYHRITDPTTFLQTLSHHHPRTLSRGV